jgi:hypothetical protein
MPRELTAERGKSMEDAKSWDKRLASLITIPTRSIWGWF